MQTLIVLVGACVLCIAMPSTGAERETPEREILMAQADAPAPPGEGAPPRRTPPSDDIEEIVVQAGESEAAADLQAGDSVTGFDASDLEALGAQSIEDLAGFTPNLEIVTTGATTPTFFIRGVGLNDFAANSSGSVAIYQDDVPKNSPALQLSTLFDVEAVNILRGPQGSGPFRSASAGAIKIYSKKPSGEFGGFLRSELGNYDFRDFEGAVEMPMVEDVLSGRFAFRFTGRDGYGENRCGDAPPLEDRPVLQGQGVGNTNNDLIHIITPATAAILSFVTGTPIQRGHSVCGDTVTRLGLLDPNRTVFTPGQGALSSDGRSWIEEGLPTEINDLGNWATRATMRFQPTLDQDWLLTGNFSKRNQYSPLGQSYGTALVHTRCQSNDPIEQAQCNVEQTFGGPDAKGYRPIEILTTVRAINPCLFDAPLNRAVAVNGDCPPGPITQAAINDANIAIQENLGGLDRYPYEGDYNHVGRTKNDVWGVSLKGDMALGNYLTLRTVSGYDTYNRTIDQDLDFSPNKLFELRSDDDGWQGAQDIELSGSFPGEIPVTWNLGAFGLYEELNANTFIDLPQQTAAFGVRQRVWEQKLLSLAGYAGFSWDFWDDFTLDGGVRYNWEDKDIQLDTYQGFNFNEANFDERAVWQAPTGQIRLTYRFREDTQAYWKYSRGWKGGHFNVTVNPQRGISSAEPEDINSFEAGLRGAWFSGRLALDASVFHYDYTNYQIFTVEIPLFGNPEFVVLNANDAIVYGGEADIRARPLPGMFLQARLAWLESEFIDFVRTQGRTVSEGPGQVSQTVTERDASGNRLLNSPQFKVSLTAEQTLPLGRYGSLSFRWDGNWTDDTYYDSTEGDGLGTFDGKTFLPENTIGQEAFWLHNFSIDYRTPDGSISVGAWVRNAFDEVYKTFAFDASGLQVNRTTIFFTGEPRMYGGSFSITF